MREKERGKMIENKKNSGGASANTFTVRKRRKKQRENKIEY